MGVPLEQGDVTRQTSTTRIRRYRSSMFLPRHTNGFAPISSAFVISTKLPRSLKTPVGFAPSSFMKVEKIRAIFPNVLLDRVACFPQKALLLLNGRESDKNRDILQQRVEYVPMQNDSFGL